MEIFNNIIVKSKLDFQKVKYEILPYPKGLRNTIEIAKYLNIAPESLFKSIVMIIDNKPSLFVLPACKNLDINRIEEEMNLSKVRIAIVEEAEKITGMKVGGISPLGIINSKIPIYVEISLNKGDFIYMSAGQRGFVLKLHVSDFLDIMKSRSSFQENIQKKLPSF